MQLTLFTDYALRVLIYSAHKKGELATMREISDFYGVSAEHLRKVIHSLTKAGYLNSYRGAKGGIELAAPGSKIRVGDVVKDMQGSAPVIDCEGRDCLLSIDCVLKNALTKGMNAFYAELKNYSLEDIANNEPMRKYFSRI